MEMLDTDFDYDLMRICRSCRRNDQKLHPIFESYLQSHNGATLLERLTSCTQLQITYDDGMPPNVCSICVTDINVAYSFRKRSEQSDKVLKEYLSRKRISVDDSKEDRVNVELFDIKSDITCTERTLEPQHEQNDDRLIDELEDEDCGNVEDDVSVDSEEHLDEGSLDEFINAVKKMADSCKRDSSIKEGQLGCDSRESAFPDKRDVGNNANQHEPKKIKKCTLCNRTFNKTFNLNRHMKIHQDSKIQCDHCEKRMASHSEYRKHMTLEHPNLPIQAQRKSCKPDLSAKQTVKTKLEAICQICDTTFDRIAELRNHLKTHVDPKTFADVNFQTKPYLFEEDCVPDNFQDFIVQQVIKWDVHRFCQIVQPGGEELELSDSDSDPEDEDTPLEGIVHRDHVSELCNQSFSRIKTIVEHAKTYHRPEDLIGCRYCSRGFPNNDLLKRHLRQQCENHSKKLSCSFCNEKFMWQTSLNKHAQSKHKPTKPLVAQSEAVKKDHNSSKKNLECAQCHKKFNRSSNLRSHMKIHKKDTETEPTKKQRIWLCVYCGRGFPQSANLIIHMRRHTGERPYKCDICDKGFPRSYDLQCHRRIHTGEKPCLCTICGKGFYRPNNLRRHMRIHTGTRPYSCTYCDRSFTQSNDLILHIRRHTGEKPYVCGVCNERFMQGTGLKAHQRETGHFDDPASEDGLPREVKPIKPRRKSLAASSQSTAATVDTPDSEAVPPNAI